MNRSAQLLSRVVWLVSITGILAGSVGCHLMPDPFTDELLGLSKVTTLSADAARASSATPADLKRCNDRIEIQTPSGAVTHGPLYFEDGFEDAGSDDGEFAWGSEDYLQLFYWRARFSINAALFPISVVATPPHVTMVSDGRTSRELCGISHDAERSAK